MKAVSHQWSVVSNVLCFALCAVLVALCSPIHAQQPGKVSRIGFLDTSTASGSAVLLNAFQQELSKLGWMAGKNITFEYRFAEQKNERLPGLAKDLVRLKVDLIVVSGTGPASAAKNATTTVPIVMANIGDPVRSGLIASLAQPGGNVTGNASLSPELITKRLEVLKDTIPKLARVGFLRQAGISQGQLKELRPAALALKLQLEEIEIQYDLERLESAFQSATQRHVDAFMMPSSPSLFR